MEQIRHSIKNDKPEKSNAQFGLLGIIISMGIVYGDIGTSCFQHWDTLKVFFYNFV